MQDFVILGLADCFIKDDENQLQPIKVIEPIPSAAFLPLLQKSPSSYSTIKAFQYQDVMNAIESNTSALGFSSEAQLSSNFEERLEASARTYEHNPDAKTKISIGESIQLDTRSPHKRILNTKRTVNSSDNVKQHSHAMKTL